MLLTMALASTPLHAAEQLPIQGRWEGVERCLERRSREAGAAAPLRVEIKGVEIAERLEADGAAERDVGAARSPGLRDALKLELEL